MSSSRYAATLLLATLALPSVLSQETYNVSGVIFTEDDRQRVIDLANFASFETLHFTFDLFDFKAQNIIDARGWYNSLEQIDAVEGINYTPLTLLRDVSRALASGCDGVAVVGGTVEGVAFTDREARLVVKAAQEASFVSLVDVADVYEFKAEAIFEARAEPLCSLTDVASVDGVTTFVLNLLKSTYAQSDACLSSSDCPALTFCEGVPSDGILAGGKCWRELNLEFTPCEATGDECGDELCLLDSCVQREFAATFATPAHQDGGFVVVPAAAGAVATGVFAVSGLATVPVDVVLTVERGDVSDASDVVITLTDPNGVEASFWNGPEEAAAGASFPVSRRVGNSGDDTINGAWTVNVKAVSGAATGSFEFSLYLTSRYD